MSLRNGLLVAFAAVALSQTLGCGGDGINREDLTGTVTFAGSPVKYGQIMFVPTGTGPAGEAEIVDGKYDTATGGQGIVPGPHKVQVTAYEERPEAGTEDETQVVEAKPPLFVRYELQADLTGGEQNFDVPEEARGHDPFKGANRREGYAP